MDHLKLTLDKLSVEAISDLVVDDSCGAVSMFVGTTRDNFEGKKVLQLEYDAYESMALKAMKSICDEVRSKWPAVYGIAMYHRLGNVPCREASVVIAVSSPHRRESLDAVSHLIERLKASVPIWKKEIYEGAPPEWKENTECPPKPAPHSSLSPTSPQPGVVQIDKNLIQINVSNEELQQRINNFIERKREQVNVSNIRDFIPSKSASETEETDTCARVRTQFIKRKDSKGHLKIHKVHNEWGPQTIQRRDSTPDLPTSSGLPPSIAERVLEVEGYLNIKSVSRDVFKRLKDIEDKVAYLQTVSPEYAQFWKNNSPKAEVKEQYSMDYTFSADDIARKIELLEKQAS